MIHMKVNYIRTVEKQRQEAWDKRQKEREEFLSKMSTEERETYLANESQRAIDALKILGMAQSMLGDSPYSKL